MLSSRRGWWAVYLDFRDWWVGVYVSDRAAYPHAVRAIKAAEAEHGEPVPTCLCGGRITYTHTAYGGRCDACGQSPLDSARKGPL